MDEPGCSTVQNQCTVGISQPVPDYEYARQGIKLWINNTPKLADEHFKKRLDKLQVNAAHSLITFMNAIMSCENDKMEEAQVLIRNLEKLCAHEVGWMKTVKSRFFGSKSGEEKTLVTYLEEQIILADTQLCAAIVVGLGQDISGFVKAGWLLRKAWKVYQHTYNQIFELYNKIAVDAVAPPAIHANVLSKGSEMNLHVNSEWTVPNSAATTPSSSTSLSNSGKMKKSISAIIESKKDATVSSSNTPMTKSKTSFFSIESGTGHTSTNNGHAKDTSANAGFRMTNANDQMGKMDVERLMGGISFGYGVLQLSISLLPPNLLRLISFFGFEGDRSTGIQCLMQARLSTDMRAPLATYTLLWYFTIITPFFSVDGYNLRDEIAICTKLIDEITDDFGDAALTLFFSGRLERLKSQIKEAIVIYNRATQVSAQQEIGLLCLHEISWCNLIQLDYENGFANFQQLSCKTKFSKSFYVYLSTICEGAQGRTENILQRKSELYSLIDQSKTKDSQIDRFIVRRISKIPDSNNNIEIQKVYEAIYWRFYVYEMLILWNALNSCSKNSLNNIVIDCSEENADAKEPMIGLTELIIASCHACLLNYKEAISAYRKCIDKRISSKDLSDTYITAYAHYELAVLLLKHETGYEAEAKQLLQFVQTNCKNYDFENRVSVRVHALLKRLQ